MWADFFCCLLLLQRTKLGLKKKKRGGFLQGSLMILICWGRREGRGGDGTQKVARGLFSHLLPAAYTNTES